MKKEYLWAMMITCILPFQIYSWDDSPPCFKSLQRNFFRETYLNETFSFHQTDVTQSNWNAIYRALQQGMELVPGMVKRRAEALDVNPLDNPFQPQIAKQILLDVLYEVFVKVMYTYGVQDPYAIRDMFNYVVSKHLADMNACFGPEPAPKKR